MEEGVCRCSGWAARAGGAEDPKALGGARRCPRPASAGIWLLRVCVVPLLFGQLCPQAPGPGIHGSAAPAPSQQLSTPHPHPNPRERCLIFHKNLGMTRHSFWLFLTLFPFPLEPGSFPASFTHFSLSEISKM